MSTDIGGLLEDLVLAAVESGVCKGLNDDTQAACDRIYGAFKQVERERDEARGRMAQAVALLREAKRCVFGDDANRIEREIDAFLAGQPAPVKLAVDDAVVERACAAMWNGVWPHDCVNPDDQRNDMRAALVAALEGRT